MNKENASKLWKMIQEAGDYLEGKLPDHPNHPKGRNPYAHIAICIKSKFNNSYKDIEDEKYNEVIEYIDNARKTFKSLSPEEVSFPRSASNVEKYKSHSTIYAKGTPIHIRGALLFNHYIKNKKLTNKYSLIGNGEKVKFLYLKKPNVIQENVISFIQDFPHELDLDRYIDHDLQFEKSFVEPLKTILDAIGWNVEKTVNLESFFM